MLLCRLQCSSQLHRTGPPLCQEKAANKGCTSEVSSEENKCYRNRRITTSTSGSILKDSLLSAQLIKENNLHSELAQKYINFYETLETEIPSWELRIINGTYNVSSYSIPSISAQVKNNGRKDETSDEEMPLPTPNYIHKPNAVNQGVIDQLLQRLLFFVTSRQKRMYIEKNHSILKDINLRFESGKMYLVLGAPGSGKVREFIALK